MRVARAVRQRPQAALFALLLVLALLTWLAPWPLLRYASVFAFLWVLPGLGWILFLPPSTLNPIEQLVVALGLSFVVTPVAIVLLSYLPGPVTRLQILVAVVALAAFPLVVSYFLPRVRSASAGAMQVPAPEEHARPLPTWRSLRRGPWLWLLIAVVVAVALRLVNLSYSEFQGDEAEVMIHAARALEGDESILFLHKKAPGELAVIMGSWRLTGIINEWMARLPFAWANLLGLTAVALLCRRLGRTPLAAAALALLAIEGYLVAFGRIVQYQSLVFALSSLALLCLVVFLADGRRSLVLVAAILFAGGFLAHYDAALTLPAGLVLVGARLWADRRHLGRAMIPLLVAASVALVLVAFFYLPFLLSPNLDHTSSYLSGRLGTGFSNNLHRSFLLTAVYDSIFYLVAMLLALGVTILSTWSGWGRRGHLLAGALLLLVATTALWPERWLVGQVTLAWVPHATLLLGATLAPGQPMTKRAVWAWFAAPWLFYLFVVGWPLTHVHVFFPAWSVLVAMGVVQMANWLVRRARITHVLAAILAVAFYLVCAYYPVMMFVDHTPEYRRTFPDFKSPVYWTPYEQIPKDGLFGFPYRAGWKVVGYLWETGVLEGNYSSNEESAITEYYTLKAPRSNCPTPDLYITAESVQDEVPIRRDQIEPYYVPGIQVTVGEQPKLVVHQRTRTSASGSYAVEDYARLFDQFATPAKLAAPARQFETVISDEYVEQDLVFGGFARVTGYQLDAGNAVPGGYIDLVLRWQVLESASASYTLFTHLDNGVAMLGQLDGQPACATRPTTTWRPGEVLVDTYRIPVRADASLGPVPLYLGMYDSSTGDRLSIVTSDDSEPVNVIHLADVLIREP